MGETTPPVCEICTKQPSKYKCPHCTTRYCSVRCFKEHIDIHDQDQEQEEDDQPNQISQNEETHQNQQSPSPPPQKPNQTTTLRTNPQFMHLLSKHPSLLQNLRHIYHLTKHPSALPESVVSEMEEARRKNPNTPRKQRTEIWTQSKADERALGMMIEMQLRDEGVAEFLDLVRVVCSEDEGDDGGGGVELPIDGGGMVDGNNGLIVG